MTREFTSEQWSNVSGKRACKQRHTARVIRMGNGPARRGATPLGARFPDDDHAPGTWDLARCSMFNLSLYFSGVFLCLFCLCSHPPVRAPCPRGLRSWPVAQLRPGRKCRALPSRGWTPPIILPTRLLLRMNISAPQSPNGSTSRFLAIGMIRDNTWALI